MKIEYIQIMMILDYMSHYLPYDPCIAKAAFLTFCS